MRSIIHFIILTLLVAIVSSCDISSKTVAKLERPLGIITEGDVFSEFAPVGQVLPFIFSYAFANADDNQTAVQITLAQKDKTGQEIITVAVVDNLPPKPKAKSNIVVTAKIDINKKLTMKVTIPDTAYIKEFGPFDVN